MMCVIDITATITISGLIMLWIVISHIYVHALSNMFICISLLFTWLIAQSTIVGYMLTYICLVI